MDALDNIHCHFRHAVATSRAAMFSNAYYGGNTAPVAMPTANMMQQIPVAGQSVALQPIQYR